MIDQDWRRRATAGAGVTIQDTAFAGAQAFEPHLALLAHTAGHVAIVPLAVGAIEAGAVADLLTILWGGAETLIVAIAHENDPVIMPGLALAAAQAGLAALRIPLSDPDVQPLGFLPPPL
jgi:hypothetical protein